MFIDFFPKENSSSVGYKKNKIGKSSKKMEGSLFVTGLSKPLTGKYDYHGDYYYYCY
jgi:hypothetical protein